jgi:hypothetical protein
MLGTLDRPVVVDESDDSDATTSVLMRPFGHLTKRESSRRPIRPDLVTLPLPSPPSPPPGSIRMAAQVDDFAFADTVFASLSTEEDAVPSSRRIFFNAGDDASVQCVMPRAFPPVAARAPSDRLRLVAAHVRRAPRVAILALCGLAVLTCAIGATLAFSEHGADVPESSEVREGHTLDQHTTRRIVVRAKR